MKNIFLGFLIIGGLYACSNDFEIAEEPKDIPIVYGLLNPLDTANYIRIEKAFIDEDIPAADLAQDPSNLYYDNLIVSLALCEDATCAVFGEEFIMNRVDGNLEGFVREDGFFAEAPNYLYKATSTEFLVQEAMTYRLRIQRGEGLDDVIALTTVIDNPRVTAPSSLGKLVFERDKEVLYKWTYPTNSELIVGSIYDITLAINYSESVSNGPFEPKTLIWNFANNIRYNNEDNGASVAKIGDEFYNFLNQNLVANDQTLRILNNADFILDSGGPELTSYINVGLANTGITSTQPLPVFTNLSEGRGIFSSKNQIRILGLGFSTATLDELRDGNMTKALNFQ